MVHSLKSVAAGTLLVLCFISACAACGNPMGTQSYSLGEGEPAHKRGGSMAPKQQTCRADTFVVPRACNSSTTTHKYSTYAQTSTAYVLAGPSAHAKRLASSPRWQDKSAVDFRAPAGVYRSDSNSSMRCCVPVEPMKNLRDQHVGPARPGHTGCCASEESARQ